MNVCVCVSNKGVWSEKSIVRVLALAPTQGEGGGVGANLL